MIPFYSVRGKEGEVTWESIPTGSRGGPYKDRVTTLLAGYRSVRYKMELEGEFQKGDNKERPDSSNNQVEIKE